MSLANRITLPFALFGLVLLAACGTNNNGVWHQITKASPTPTLLAPMFFLRKVTTPRFLPLNLAGAFAANGSGGVTGGSSTPLTQSLHRNQSNDYKRQLFCE